MDMAAELERCAARQPWTNGRRQLPQGGNVRQGIGWVTNREDMGEKQGGKRELIFGDRKQ